MVAINKYGVLKYAILLCCLLQLSPSKAQTSIDISTAQQLADFAEKVNSGDINACQADVNLLASIDLSGVAAWTPIGRYESCAFSGKFHGNKHAIYGFTCLSDNNAGLFGYIGETGEVDDLLIGGEIKLGCTTGYIGGIAACNYGNITRCGNVADITLVGNGNIAGGIVGSNGSQTSTTLANITDCYSRGTISYNLTSSSTIGGMVGNIEANGRLSGCYSTIAIGDGSRIGAFFGVFNGDKDNIHNCFYEEGLGGSQPNNGDLEEEPQQPIVKYKTQAEMKGDGIRDIATAESNWLFEDGEYPELFYIPYTPKALCTWDDAEETLGVGTFSASDNVSLPSGIEAVYIINDNNGEVLSLRNILSSDASLPIQTPVLITGQRGKTYYLRVLAKTLQNTTTETNLLKPHVEAGNIPTDGSLLYYGLFANGQFCRLSAEGIFPAHSAYLDLENNALSPAYFSLMVDDEATGINSLHNSSMPAEYNAWYSLSGRRLSATTRLQPGIYIYNNKKVRIK